MIYTHVRGIKCPVDELCGAYYEKGKVKSGFINIKLGGMNLRGTQQMKGFLRYQWKILALAWERAKGKVLNSLICIGLGAIAGVLLLPRFDWLQAELIRVGLSELQASALVTGANAILGVGIFVALLFLFYMARIPAGLHQEQAAEIAALKERLDDRDRARETKAFVLNHLAGLQTVGNTLPRIIPDFDTNPLASAALQDWSQKTEEFLRNAFGEHLVVDFNRSRGLVPLTGQMNGNLARLFNRVQALAEITQRVDTMQLRDGFTPPTRPA